MLRSSSAAGRKGGVLPSGSGRSERSRLLLRPARPRAHATKQRAPGRAVFAPRYVPPAKPIQRPLKTLYLPEPPRGDARMADHLITSDPGGRPVIAGTHVSVEEVLKELAASQAVDDILTAHPELDRHGVEAALAYAAAAVHNTASTPSVGPSRKRSRLRHGRSTARNYGNSGKKPLQNSVNTTSRCLTWKASGEKCATGEANATLGRSVDPHVSRCRHIDCGRQRPGKGSGARAGDSRRSGAQLSHQRVPQDGSAAKGDLLPAAGGSRLI